MQRDKGLYRRCYGPHFDRVANCLDMSLHSIAVNKGLEDEHGPALRAKTLDTIGRLVVIAGKPEAIGVDELLFVLILVRCVYCFEGDVYIT